MRIGSLFSGAGGLDLAVQAVFGGEVVWHAEIDKAASKVLAYRFPGVLNLGDVSDINWDSVPPVDILCGGFPCQDVSAAGRRAGIKDGTRSGLWAVFAEAIDWLHPRIVVIENVRGLLSAAAHRMEPDETTLGNGSDRPVLRAAGAVLGDLADIGYDAQWATVAAADVGAPHRRERVFIVATDSACNGRHEGRPEPVRLQRGFDAAVSGDGHGVDTPLLPTPCAQQSGNSPEEHLAKKPGRKVVTDLAILVENGLLESGGALLPTPRSSDCFGAGQDGDGGIDLRTTVTLLPTPRASDPAGAESRSSEGFRPQLGEVARTLLPTPKAHDGEFGTPRTSGRPIEKSTHLGTIASLEQTTHWGKYEPAIRRWEQLTRPAPAPTEPNKNGNPRLSAAFSEWLMGWPDGWVTDPDIGISRNDQLRIVGNGVCPQQAAAALRYLMAVAA